MAILYIDTKDSKKISVCVGDGNKKYCEKEVANKLLAQTTLPLIQKLLKKNNLKIDDVSEIIVEKGPGSFTGLRVGVSIANTLSFSKAIKVNGKELGNIELPEY